jgi:hypothetical protein
MGKALEFGDLESQGALGQRRVAVREEVDMAIDLHLWHALFFSVRTAEHPDLACAVFDAA